MSGPQHRPTETGSGTDTGTDTGAGPVDPHRPVVDGRERTPEELRGELEELRQDLGSTVEELAHRVDVPTRVRERRAEVSARARVQLARAQSALDDKAPPVGRAVRERPALVAGAVVGVPLLLLLVGRLRRGNRSG
jgi:hypothetical protein